MIFSGLWPPCYWVEHSCFIC